MSENKEYEDWVTIGFICRLPIQEIPEAKRYLKEKGIVVFSKISGGKLFLKEASPSGSGDYGEE